MRDGLGESFLQTGLGGPKIDERLESIAHKMFCLGDLTKYQHHYSVFSSLVKTASVLFDHDEIDLAE